MLKITFLNFFITYKIFRMNFFHFAWKNFRRIFSQLSQNTFACKNICKKSVSIYLQDITSSSLNNSKWYRTLSATYGKKLSDKTRRWLFCWDNTEQATFFSLSLLWLEMNTRDWQWRAPAWQIAKNNNVCPISRVELRGNIICTRGKITKNTSRRNRELEKYERANNGARRVCATQLVQWQRRFVSTQVCDECHVISKDPRLFFSHLLLSRLCLSAGINMWGDARDSSPANYSGNYKCALPMLQQVAKIVGWDCQLAWNSNSL